MLRDNTVLMYKGKTYLFTAGTAQANELGDLAIVVRVGHDGQGGVFLRKMCGNEDEMLNN